MSEVAKMLGVELGERFELNLYDEYDKKAYGDNEYYLCENGVKLDKKDRVCISSDLLLWILCGRVTIKRKPWKPQLDEYYWHIDVDGSHHLTAWQGVSFDRNYYKLGNCYQTAEEAKANRDKWVAFYKTDEVLEV